MAQLWHADTSMHDSVENFRDLILKLIVVSVFSRSNSVLHLSRRLHGHDSHLRKRCELLWTAATFSVAGRSFWKIQSRRFWRHSFLNLGFDSVLIFKCRERLQHMEREQFVDKIVQQKQSNLLCLTQQWQDCFRDAIARHLTPFLDFRKSLR